MSKPKIRHLAIMTLDPEKLAKFYEEVFGMTRLPKRGAPTSKAIYMSDGYLTLALLENKADGKPSGLNHFGWQIDDQGEMAERLRKAGVRAPVQRPADGRYAETRSTDPDGNNFDLAVAGYSEEEGSAATTRERVPA